MGNAEPLEIIWALVFSIACGNYLTELRLVNRQRRRVVDLLKEGLIPAEAAGSRMIEAWRNIAANIMYTVICFLMAVPGYIGILMSPIDGRPRVEFWTGVATICIVGAGLLIFIHSCSMRYFSRKLNTNLLWRKRQSDPQGSTAYLHRKV